MNKTINDTTKIFIFQILSIIFMLIAVILACKNYSETIEKTILWIFKSVKEIKVTLRPSLLSTLIAIVLYSSLIIRGFFCINLKQSNNIFIISFELVITVLNILFIASFISLFCTDKPWNIFGIDVNSTAVLIITCAFSWLGMKSIAGYSWILLFMLSITRMTQLDVSMGFCGVIYVICAFLSIFLQLISQNKFEDFAKCIIEDFRKSGKYISQDIHSAGETTKNVINMASGGMSFSSSYSPTEISSNKKIEDKNY